SHGRRSDWRWRPCSPVAARTWRWLSARRGTWRPRLHGGPSSGLSQEWHRTTTRATHEQVGRSLVERVTAGGRGGARPGDGVAGLGGAASPAFQRHARPAGHAAVVDRGRAGAGRTGTRVLAGRPL